MAERSQRPVKPSSLKATGHASVRATPAAQVAGSVWALDELAGGDKGRGGRALPSQVTAEERARLIDEGYARGLADGEAKARAAAQATVNQAVASMRGVAAELSEAGTLAPSILEENIAALAVVVARQIVAKEVTVEKDLVANLVRRALTEFPIDQGVRIRVNPLDLSLLTANSAGDAVGITGNRDATWLADPRVSRGGCLIEGRDRIVDGRVDTALERAYRRMAQIDA
jgi:flagellar biosynthesis/type III secretory pathway protein FliH